MRHLGKRVCQTADGRYVYEGNPEAAYLAYSQYAEVPDDVVEQLDGGRKARKAPANKARQADSDKADGDASRRQLRDED